ncbi:helix-turn-helix domain-containing protein [Brevibacillus reuszeri]|uniref:helix-turn-helix domain-containing protein n=1 Tax=Brevibacillus reuszeri TaxID=54915 RepID=UPI000CCC0ABD|nr:helix-turn-helix transcriptional regulator [Brevibacillus reuszeri]
MVIIKRIGDLLKGLRGDRSLREIERISGVSHTYLSSLEKGVDPRSGNPITPTPETLNKLSKAYNFSYRQLMKLAGYLDEEYDNDEGLDESLIRALRSLSEDGYFHPYLREDLFQLFEGQFAGPDYEEFEKHFRQYLNTKDEEPDYIDEDLLKEFDIHYNIKTLRHELIEYASFEWKENLLTDLEILAKKIAPSNTGTKQHSELHDILKRPSVTYHSHLLTDQDKQLITAYLDALFRDRISSEK